MKDEDIVQLAKDNPYQVIQVKRNDGKYFLVLYGGLIIEPESWSGLPIAVPLINTKKEEVGAALEDLRDSYKEITKTDGSKVNWNPIIL